MQESRPNFICERRPDFMGTYSAARRAHPRLKGRRGRGRGGLWLPMGFRASPRTIPGAQLARDPSDASNSPKGQTSPEHFRECTPTGVGASLPT